MVGKGFGKLFEILASAFLPVVVRRMTEGGRRKRRKRNAQDYLDMKSKDRKRTTRENYLMFRKYHPRISKITRANRDEALDTYRRRANEIYDGR